MLNGPAAAIGGITPTAQNPVTQSTGGNSDAEVADLMGDFNRSITGVANARTADGGMDPGEVLNAAQGMVDFGIKATAALDVQIAEGETKIASLESSGAPEQQVTNAREGQKVLEALRVVIAKHTERLAEILRSRGRGPSDDDELKLEQMKRERKQADEISAVQHAAQVAEMTAPRPQAIQPPAAAVAAAYGGTP